MKIAILYFVLRLKTNIFRPYTKYGINVVFENSLGAGPNMSNLTEFTTAEGGMFKSQLTTACLSLVDVILFPCGIARLVYLCQNNN